MTLTIKLDKSNLHIEYLLVYIFFALTLVLFLFRYSTVIFDIRLIFLIIGAIDGYYISIKKKLNYPFWLAVFFSVCWIFCWAFQTSLNFSPTDFLYTLCYIGFSVLLLEGFFGIWGSGILFLLCAGVIVYRYLRGVDPGELLTHTSRNFISVILLFTILLFYLALLKSKNERNLFWFLPAIIFFGISVVAVGRGGILTSGFLLCALIVYKSLATDKLRAKRGLRIVVLLIIAFVVVYFISGTQVINLFSGLFSRFSERGAIDASRIAIWSSFFRNNVISVRDFIFGSDASLIRGDGNLHNSFLQSYAAYGLVAFCVLVVLLVRAFVYGIKNKEYLWTILLVTLLLRAFTDRLFFQGYCEVFLYYFLMYGKHKSLSIKK